MISTLASPALSAAGVSAPMTLGLSLAAVGVYAAIKELPKIRQGARTASDFTSKFQQKFQDDILAPIAEQAKTDPQGAAKLLSDAWPAYLKEANAYASGDATKAKVVQQMLYSTPALTNTVSSILKPLGVGALDPTFTQNVPAAGQAPNAMNTVMSTLNGGRSMSNPSLSEVIPGLGGSTPGNLNIPGLNTGSGSGSNGIVGILGKIFGATGNDDKSIIDSLVKLGIPLTASVLNGLSATNAANKQAQSYDAAGNLQQGATQASLNGNNPFLQGGTDAFNQVLQKIGPGGQDSKQFVAPTADEVRAEPGYQLDLSEAMKAINAASRGVVSGSTIKAADRFATDYADTKYDTATSRDLNIFQTNRNNDLNPLLQVAGMGQSAANANSAINQTGATQLGQTGEEAAAARASGYGKGAFSQVLNQLQQQQIYSKLGL